MKTKLSLLCSLILLLDAPRLLAADPNPAAIAAFNTYTRTVESRIAQQHRSPNTFLAPTPPHQPNPIIERIPTPEIPNAILHHWRGTAFAPGATAADFEHLLRDFNAYPHHFAPQVLTASATPQSPNRTIASMRIRQHHVLTVVLDATYDVTFAQLDPAHGYSISQSTRIAEIDSPNTPAEHALSPANDHGFLYRLNTYWSYEERDGGLYLQIEAISLTRSIPTGLAWAIRPCIESIPRESLAFTLNSATNALRK
jgi:hypothetical protein